MSGDIERILIIKLRAVGDVLLATPVVRNLRRHYPHAFLAFLTESLSREVLEGNPDLDEILVFNGRDKSWRQNIEFINRLRWMKFDLVIDLFGNPRSALMTFLSGAKCRVGFDFRVRRFAYDLVVRSRGGEVHEVEFNLDVLQALGMEVVDRELIFPLTDEAREFAEIFLQGEMSWDRPLIGISPSGGWPAKRWTDEGFAELGDKLAEGRGGQIMLLWGPGEEGRVNRIARMMNHQPIIAPRTNLKQLAAFMERCWLVVSNDSGPMHISVAVGTPTVGIFGPTDPKLQGPWGPGHAVVRNEEIHCLGCNRLTCETHECMKGLGSEEVYRVTEMVLDGISG